MGPKPATPDESLQFILQCLHSIRDANGKVVAPDYKAVSQLRSVKPNTVYVRYRNIVERERTNGIQGLQPVGNKAIAAAAAAQLNTSNDFASHPTPLSMTSTKAATTATSSPMKGGTYGRKRKRAADSFEDYGGNDKIGTWDYVRLAPAKKSKTSKKNQIQIKYASSAESPVTAPQQPTTNIMTPTITDTTPHSELDLGHASFIDFEGGPDLLHLGDPAEATDYSSDADADGESDIEY